MKRLAAKPAAILAVFTIIAWIVVFTLQAGSASAAAWEPGVIGALCVLSGYTSALVVMAVFLPSVDVILGTVREIKEDESGRVKVQIGMKWYSINTPNFPLNRLTHAPVALHRFSREANWTLYVEGSILSKLQQRNHQ